MQNITTAIEGNDLVIRIDLTQSAGLSKSGKNLIIGTSSGNKQVATLNDGRKVTLGLNCYTSLEDGDHA